MALPYPAAQLCDRCLGRRLIGAAGQEPQEMEGANRRAAEGGKSVAAADCPVCEDAFQHLDTWTDLAMAALKPYEFTTFQVGTLFPDTCQIIEKEAAAALGMEPGEVLRTEANRLLAARIKEATGADTAAEGRPDVVVTVDTRFHFAEAQSNSVFIAGRYTKHRRDVPQTHWPCKRCQGLGCWECDDAGVMYAESVEQAIGDVLAPVFGADSYSFHGAGREDIDALMLEGGRPFVLEVKNPKPRRPELAATEAAINAVIATTGVGVQGFRMTEKEEVARIKEATYDKEYLAHCLTDSPVSADALRAAAEGFAGQVLDQQTPQRVAHRRADLVRNRTVHHITVETPLDDAGTRFTLRIRAESGTYIKEMVNGDDGRTTPSFGERLGVPCAVEFLDVVGILDGPTPALAQP